MIRSLSHILAQAAASFNEQISYTTTLYCPRCDKPLAPDHRCLNRRHFFGLFAGTAAAILVPPAISLPVPSPSPAIIISNQLYRIPFQVYRGGAFRHYSDIIGIAPFLHGGPR